MRLAKFALCSSLIAFLPSLAFAGSYEAAGFTWTGFFVGATAGYARGTSDWDFSGGSSGSSNRTVDGGLVGLRGGYNAQLGSGLVAGIEVSAQAADISGKNHCSGSDCKSGINSLSDVSGRLGANWGKNLIFGKAGVAYRNMDYGISNQGAKDKSGSTGYVAGGGVEFYVLDNVTSNIEYNYYHFGSGSGTIGTTHIEDSSTLSLIKAGFSIKFN